MSEVLKKLSDTDATLFKNQVGEWDFELGGERTPAQATRRAVDVRFSGPGGVESVVPAFWRGGDIWSVRFSTSKPGNWTFELIESSGTDSTTSTGSFEVVDRTWSNPLLDHGGLTVGPDERSFAHEDGEPFFLLSDTWWLGMSDRITWPEEFMSLVQHRARQGYTMVRLTAGLNTDTGEFDPRAANEGGQPWTPEYDAINPAFFDAADQRVFGLVDHGIVPAIIGAWGFFLPRLGIETMKVHWRNVVARWGAFPVFWYLTIEYDMHFYADDRTGFDEESVIAGWTEVGHYLRGIDPFKRLISTQSWTTRHSARRNLRDDSIIDVDSLQIGHGDVQTVNSLAQILREARAIDPPKPVLAADLVYEGIQEQNWANVQRMAFWCAVLNGSAGFSYGANGIWQFEREESPFGAAPGGIGWGGDPWHVSMHYHGARQIAMNAEFLRRYEYWEITPRPEWYRDEQRECGAEPHCGAIGGAVRFLYLPFQRSSGVLLGLDPNTNYNAFWFDPVHGTETSIGVVQADASGELGCPRPPLRQDHVLVLERSLG